MNTKNGVPTVSFLAPCSTVSYSCKWLFLWKSHRNSWRLRRTSSTFLLHSPWVKRAESALKGVFSHQREEFPGKGLCYSEGSGLQQARALSTGASVQNTEGKIIRNLGKSCVTSSENVDELHLSLNYSVSSTLLCLERLVKFHIHC